MQYTHRQQVCELWVEVQRHDAALGAERELGVRGVLEGEDADEAAGLQAASG